MTQIEFIKSLFTPECELSCNDVCKQVAVKFKGGHTKRDISANVTSRLRELVKAKYLKYSINKTPRGGHIYELNQ